MLRPISGKKYQKSWLENSPPLFQKRHHNNKAAKSRSDKKMGLFIDFKPTFFYILFINTVIT